MEGGAKGLGFGGPAGSPWDNPLEKGAAEREVGVAGGGGRGGDLLRESLGPGVQPGSGPEQLHLYPHGSPVRWGLLSRQSHRRNVGLRV